MSEPFKEALKELLRVIALAVVPVVISFAEAGTFSWREVALVGVIAGLRFVDKLLYLEGKEKENKILEGGLTRF